MSLLDLPIPPKPAAFTPEGAPPGVALRLDVYGKWPASRQKIKPRLGIVHTNGASVEASVQSSINYGNAAAANTKPHYLVGDKPAKVLATNLRGIANATGADIEAQYNEVDCALWSYAIETADMGSKKALATGVKWAGDCGPFLERPGDQPDDAEIVARILAYESIVWNHPLGVPPTWNHSAGGVVAHTIPFPYPHYTIQRGKTCPGSTKAAELFDEILPRARQIRAAWLDDTPPTPEEEDMKDSRLWRPKGYLNIFIITPSGNVLHASSALLTAFGIPTTNIIEDDHPQTLLSMLRLAGLTVGDLVKA